MKTMGQSEQGLYSYKSEDYSSEHIAVAVLMERMTKLPREAYEDLISLLPEMTKCETKEEYREIMETMREILFPELIGKVNLGNAGSIRQTDNLKTRMNWIGKKIKGQRKSQNLTQEDLAEKSGLKQSHISRLEAGTHSPSAKTMEKIAKALKISLGDLDPAF